MTDKFLFAIPQQLAEYVIRRDDFVVLIYYDYPDRSFFKDAPEPFFAQPQFFLYLAAIGDFL